MRHVFALSLLFSATLGPTLADADSLPAVLVCSFGDGRAASQSEGKFQTAAAAPLAFEIGRIDFEAQTAELVARAGAGPGGLRVVRALNANHFIEVLHEGFLGLTTVYDKDEKAGSYPAVHSRHGGLFGQAVVAQYTGSCKAK